MCEQEIVPCDDGLRDLRRRRQYDAADPEFADCEFPKRQHGEADADRPTQFARVSAHLSCHGLPRSLFAASTRSEWNAASRMLWVTKITVFRFACQMRKSSTPISSRVRASNALNGSSISRIPGS